VTPKIFDNTNRQPSLLSYLKKLQGPHSSTPRDGLLTDIARPKMKDMQNPPEIDSLFFVGLLIKAYYEADLGASNLCSVQPTSLTHPAF